MQQTIKASLLSAFILPGLGQVINRQIIKGLVLMALSTIWFMVLLVKLLLDFSSILSKVIGPDLSLPPDLLRRIIIEMRLNDMTVLIWILFFGAALWMYGIVDAFISARHYQPPVEAEE